MTNIFENTVNFSATTRWPTRRFESLAGEPLCLLLLSAELLWTGDFWLRLLKIQTPIRLQPMHEEESLKAVTG